MLRSLGHPVTLLGLLVGFVLAVLAHGVAQALAARLLGDRWALRDARQPKKLIDVFGVVAAAIVGPGWGVSREPSYRSKGRRVAALLAGPVAAAAVGFVGVAAFLAAGGPSQVLPEIGPSQIVRGLPGPPAEQVFSLALALEALGVAMLSLIPLPPLTGWRILSLLAPHTTGWQKARYYLEERNFGIGILLALLLLPIGVGATPLLLELVDLLVAAVLAWGR